jgi:CRP/FNR family transcriptional regulator
MLDDRLTALEVPAHTELFTENMPCRVFPLVLSGEIKVSRNSGDGRSLELYRVLLGELCLVSCDGMTDPMQSDRLN